MLKEQSESLIKLRGRYRIMRMEELEEHADDLIWHDEEKSRYEYIQPLPKTPWKAGFLTFRGWKTLAERTIVDKWRRPYALTEQMPQDELYERDGFWCAKSPPTHLSCFLHAIDYLVPDGTPVYAMMDGVITELIENNDEWGDEKDEHGEYIHRNHLNFVTIQSGAEKYQLCHIAKGSVSTLGLKVGTTVKAGQLIGKTGKNGVTDRDHLHIIVFRDDPRDENPFGFKSLVPRFRC
ncbi:MAG: M23 family metallopeptidase [bacterium]